MNETVVVKWNKGAKEQLADVVPDKIIYEVARQTLDLTYPTIPEKTGKMKRTSISQGVQGGDGTYHIGSYTNYASYVYVMSDKTHWTTPGTNAHWFKRCWQKSGKSITNTVVGRNKLK